MQDIFSVIIPSLNEEDHLPRLLKSLLAQTDQGFEVIVNDSGSTDHTEERVLGLIKDNNRFTLVKHPNKNVSAARNYGARLSHGTWIIFFDADVDIESGFIEKLRTVVSSHDLDALTVWNRPRNSTLKGRMVLAFLNAAMTLFQKIKPAANGPCIIMTRDLFNRLDGFDDTIVFGEDFNIIQRANRLHAKFAVFREPILYVSSRRFEKEGVLLTASKSMRALLYQLFIGPIRKPIFEYKMGGHHFKKD